MRVLVSALEASSNIHLEELLKFCKKDIEIVGVFDKKFGSPIATPNDFSIMGFVDVIKKISFIKKIQKEMSDIALDCDKVLLLDSSAFNIPLAKKIRDRDKNIEIIYYILPQAWAWKSWRAKTIESYCDKLCSILPFESYLYKEKYRFVGHPLLDEIELFKENASKEYKKILFMPGSRRSEVSSLMPVFNQLRESLSRSGKNYSFTIAIPQLLKGENLKDMYGDLSRYEISFDAKEALYDCDFAFICSGTATLEATLIGTPFVLTYKAKKLDFWIAKMLVRLKYVGLANIINIKRGKNLIHEELLQNEVNIKNLLQSFHKNDGAAFLSASREIRDYLSHGSSKNVAEILES